MINDIETRQKHYARVKATFDAVKASIECTVDAIREANLHIDHLVDSIKELEKRENNRDAGEG